MSSRFLPFLISALCLASCAAPTVDGQIGTPPPMWPDYSGVTVPENIAPLNFSYTGEGRAMLLLGNSEILRAKRGLFDWGERRWRRLTESSDTLELTLAVRRDGKWLAYDPFRIYVSRDRIDPWLSYRLIPPGYQGWKKMGIYQRNLETYGQTAIYENDLTDGNCINCHTCCQRDPGRMLLHARADFGGTFLSIDGQNEKLDTSTDSTISALVYPYWHPSGKYVAFSVNKTLQAFHNHSSNRVEVYDEASDVVVYDIETRRIGWSPATKSKERFETFPTFSPDGSRLYFCSAAATDSLLRNYDKLQYSIFSTSFDPETGKPGDTLTCVYDAAFDGCSASFPRISPDGRFLAFTRHGYGNFSIWHKDADICLLELDSGELRPLDGVNSPDVESWHCWSSDGRWMVVSSRRDDGLYTRPYLVHIDADGCASKAFLLPQKDPVNHYRELMYSFNLPEFMLAESPVCGRKISSVLRGNSTKVSMAR